MKIILSSLFLIALSSLQAQNVTDYKYVIVPQLFKDFAKEDFQLNTGLKTALRKKEYEIVNENSIPLDVQINPCLATKANIEEVKVMFRNNLKVTFTDCNNAVVSSYEGSSKEKDFTKGYQEALTFAMNQVGKQNAKDFKKPTISVKKTNTYTVEGEVNGEIKIPIDSSKITLNKYNLVSNGINYELIEVSNKKGSLINKDTQKLIANIFLSSKEKVVHVEVITPNGNYYTLGYANGQNLIIEYKTGNESWQKVEYFSE